MISIISIIIVLSSPSSPWMAIGWMDGGMDAGMDAGMHGWMDEWIWMDGWMEGWMNGWMHAWEACAKVHRLTIKSTQRVVSMSAMMP